MTTDYVEVNAGQQWVALLPSAARTATPHPQQVTFSGDVDAVVLVVNATAVGATGNVTVLIEGVDQATQATYTILNAGTTAVINNGNGAKTYAFRVGQSLTAGDGTANDVVPATIRITLTHSAGTSFTYSATLLCPN